MSAEAPDDLRAAHDELAVRLAVRRSIDEVRRGGYGLLASVIGTGLAAKLAYDHWWSERAPRSQGRPIWLLLAAGVAALSILFTLLAFLRARKLMAEEQADFERLRALRARLGLDP